MNQKIKIHTVSNYPVIYWHLELSSKCTLQCPRCPRTEKKGMYKVTEHTLEFVQSVLTPEVLSCTPIILLCGGQGDPIYCRDFVSIIRYIKTTNPQIKLRITTNGSHKKEEWWTEVGNILNEYDSITFSVDGWDNNSNNIYRVNSDFDSIIAGINTVRSINETVNIVWSTILFRFNQDKIKDICEIANSVGANSFNLVRSPLFGSNMPAYIDKELGYDPLEPTSISKWAYHVLGSSVCLKPTDPIFRTPSAAILEQIATVKEAYIDSPVIPLCVAGDRGLYIDAEGILYPCSWISHPFGTRKSKDRSKSITWNKSLFVEHKSNFDLHQHKLSEVLNSSLWLNLMDSWKDPNKMFVECESKCNNKSSQNRMAQYQNYDQISYVDFLEKFK